jgi:hypothetical protein
MSWYSTIFKRNPERKQLKGNNNPMPKTIYEKEGVTYDEHTKKFHRVHFWFKYKFAVPFINLAAKLFRKTLVKNIPPDNHNCNIIIFDKAFEEAILKWNVDYRRHSGDLSQRESKKYWINRSKTEFGDASNNSLRTMKEMITTMYLYDTAYREFMNILMHEIARDMCDYYKDHPNKTTGHLFFSTDIYDTQYYILEKMVEYKTMYNIHPGGDEVNNNAT